MKKFKISQDQIHYQDDKVLLSFAVDKGVPGYNPRENKFSEPFVADIDGRMYLIRPENVTSSSDGKFFLMEAVMPDRTMNDAEIIGWKLKCARQEAGITCDELADRAGVRRNTVELIEKGCFNAKINLICSLAESMGMEVTLTPME